jgi:hypothetical protein
VATLTVEWLPRVVFFSGVELQLVFVILQFLFFYFLSSNKNPAKVFCRLSKKNGIHRATMDTHHGHPPWICDMCLYICIQCMELLNLGETVKNKNYKSLVR